MAVEISSWEMCMSNWLHLPQVSPPTLLTNFAKLCHVLYALRPSKHPEAPPRDLSAPLGRQCVRHGLHAWRWPQGLSGCRVVGLPGFHKERKVAREVMQWCRENFTMTLCKHKIQRFEKTEQSKTIQQSLRQMLRWSWQNKSNVYVYTMYIYLLI